MECGSRGGRNVECTGVGKAVGEAGTKWQEYSLAAPDVHHDGCCREPHRFRSLEETLVLESWYPCVPDLGRSPGQLWAGSDVPNSAIQGAARAWCPWGCCSSPSLAGRRHTPVSACNLTDEGWVAESLELEPSLEPTSGDARTLVHQDTGARIEDCKLFP
ncbi:hypothetical protein NDU88_003674 [Pleurodeles waltl]|uniref:Uncharacterized protein n=1 Tax=Pleurodeles waltl TaxID=8319 RepID=A0AAV7RGW7_PLEWA|nr:hypothetical protein NDU88_003674 [Pleurodeles waltl]